MGRNKILRQPIRRSELNSFDDFYADISRDWEQRAERLLARRRKKLLRDE